MTTNILFAARSESWGRYQTPLTRALERTGLAYDLRPDFVPEQVDYIVYAPNSSVQDFSAYPRLKAVLNLWAGVEDVVGNPTLKVPLARMVDHGLTQGMVEWVTGHVLRHHLGMDAHITNQDGVWRKDVPPLAQDRRVTVLGLGELGQACATSLATLGFAVSGWSLPKRNGKDYLPSLYACRNARPVLPSGGVRSIARWSLLRSSRGHKCRKDGRGTSRSPAWFITNRKATVKRVCPRYEEWY